MADTFTDFLFAVGCVCLCVSVCLSVSVCLQSGQCWFCFVFHSLFKMTPLCFHNTTTNNCTLFIIFFNYYYFSILHVTKIR